MALEKKKKSDIPPDAVILSEEDAFKYHHKILNNWKINSDVLGYKYGSLLLGAASMISGFYINNYFRTKLRLFSYGRISSYLPVCTVPAMASFIMHQEAVLRDLVLLKQQQCPVCIEMRASVIQSALGFVFPLGISAVANIGLAHRFGTYNVPMISHDPLGVMKLVPKLLKPAKNIMFGILIGQALLGSAITYAEARSIYSVNFKLTELERNLENSGKLQLQ